MRYYKLTKNNFADALNVGRIYPENFREWGTKYYNIDHYVNHGYAKFFEEVPAGEYFVQEGKVPEYFAIKKVEDNPLWEKYIDWLIQTYKIIGRFDGSAKFYGYIGSTNPNTIFENSIECIVNNPIELTLEQWDKIVNKTMEEEFKLPAKWCTKIDNQEVVDYCNIHGLFPPYKINKDGNTRAHFPSWNGCTTCDGIKPGYTEITYEQFIKHVLNREVMEDKEIIGWKLKEDCEQYESAALKLVDSNRFYSFAEGYNFSTNSKNERTFKKAGVLELWFEPIYKEEFKVGDWITVIGDISGGWLENTKCRTFQITREKTEYQGGEYFGVSEAGYTNAGLYAKFRLATPEEIKAVQYPQITINGYKGEFFDNYVKFGCAEIDKNWFLQFYEIMRTVTYSNKEIESVTIGKGTFTKDQIKEIAKFYLNKK